MASRSAVMISGERNANWASSFLRSAGASWAAAALRWMTRPARSSSTAGSGMPATTALTAAASTGLMPRASSREALSLFSRQGTSAAAAMQMNATPARSGESSPKKTRKASAAAATARIKAEFRNRSGHGEKIEEDDDEGASIAIWPASPFRSGACISTLSHIGRFTRRASLKPERRLTQALRSGAEDNLPKRQQDYRDNKGHNIIKQAEQQHTGQEVLPVHLPEADQHGRIEHPEPSRGVAGEPQERGRNEDHGDHDKAEIGFVRHQHVHRQCTKAEVEDTDQYLEQRQWSARQLHTPRPAADTARLGPDPDHIADESQDDHDRDHAVQPDRQLVDRGGSLGMIGDAEPEHRGVTEPERQSGQKADLGDVDRVQPIG